MRKHRSTELEGTQLGPSSVIQKNISKPLPSASILFSRAPSCCANEVKSDLPARFSGSLLGNG